MWQEQRRFTFNVGAYHAHRFLHALTERWRYYFMEAVVGGTQRSLWSDKPFGFRERTDLPPDLPGDGPADMYRIQDTEGVVGVRRSGDTEYRLLHVQWQHGASGQSLYLCLFAPGVPGYAFRQSFVAEIQLDQRRSGECEAVLLTDPAPVWVQTRQPVDHLYLMEVGSFLGRFWEGMMHLWEGDGQTRTTDAEQPTVSLPQRPQEPQPSDGLAAWFAYRQAAQEAGYKVTLAEIAAKSGYSEGYVRTEHSKWRAEHMTEYDKTPDKI